MIKHFLVYFVGNILMNGIGFLLIPVYLSRLSPSEYGVLEVINVCTDVIITIFSAGIGIASLSLFSKEVEEENKKKVISTAVNTALGISSLGAILYILFSEDLNRYFFGVAENLALFRIAGLLMMVQILCAVPMAYLLGRMESKVYMLVSGLQSLVIMTLNIVAVVFLGMQVKGILLANVIGNSIFAFALNIWTIKKVGCRFEKEYFKRLMAFGLPFIPGGLFGFVMNSADRFFIQKFLGASSVGIYALGYKLGTIVTLAILAPFLKIWGPYMFKMDSEEGRRAGVGRYFLYVTSLYCIAGVFLSIFSREVILIFGGSKFEEGWKIIPLVVLAFLFYTNACFFDTAFYITRKTIYKPIIGGATAGLIFGLYYYLIPLYGILGGAYATAAAYGFFCLLTYVIGQSVYRIDYPLAKFGKVVVGGISAFGLSQVFHTEEFGLDLGLKGLWFVAYLLFMGFCGIVPKDEMQAGLNIFRNFFVRLQERRAEK